MATMIEEEITECLMQLPILRKKPCIIDGQSGQHPMDKTFVLVHQINEVPNGTPSITLRQSDGLFYLTRPVNYPFRISVQGFKSDGIGYLCGTLRDYFDLPDTLALFQEAGYSYEITSAVSNMPIFLNTDQFVRYSFTVLFKTSKTMPFEMNTIDGVDINGKVDVNKLVEVDVDIGIIKDK